MNLHRRTEEFATAVFAVLAVVCAWFLAVSATTDIVTLLLMIPAILLALVLADLISGILHFLLDSKGDVDTPFWGVFIRPFREHHDNPAEMTRHDFVHTNGHTAMAICPLLLLLMLRLTEPVDAVDTLLLLFLYALLLLLGLTNQFHKWAHDPRAPTITRKLQSMRLILPRRHHALHHATHENHFCITTGWNNGWLAKTRMLQRVFGEPPETNMTLRDERDC